MTKPDPPVVRAQPPFLVAEYAAAERAFVAEAIDEVCRRGDPLLREIPVERTAGRVTSRITSETGAMVELPAAEVVMTIELSGDEIRSGRPGPLVGQIAMAAEEQRKAVMASFFASLDVVTESAGTAVSGAGRSFLDTLCDALERMDLSFDGDGRISSGYRFLVHPDTYAKLEPQIAAWTPDHHARIEAVLERKREEFRARQRRRRLP